MGFDNVNVNVSGPVQPTSTYKTKVLKGNHSFASQVTEPNTKYVIKHDFVLDDDVTIPTNCVLEFDGGSLSNGAIIGSDTYIDSALVVIFNGITLLGTFTNKVLYIDWFTGGVNNPLVDCTPILEKLISLNIPVKFNIGDYYLSELLINNGDFDKVALIGDLDYGLSYKTIFHPFYDNQRYIIKIGGDRNGFGNNGTNTRGNNIKIENIYFTGDLSKGNSENPLTNNYGGTLTYYVSLLILDKIQKGKFSISGKGVNVPFLTLGFIYECHFDNIISYNNEGKSDNPTIQIVNDYVGGGITAVTIDRIMTEVNVGPLIFASSTSVISEMVINNIFYEHTIEWSDSVPAESVQTYTTVPTLNNYELVPFFDLRGYSTLVINNVVFSNCNCVWWNSADHNGAEWDGVTRDRIKSFINFTTSIRNNRVFIKNISGIATPYLILGGGAINTNSILRIENTSIPVYIKSESFIDLETDEQHINIPISLVPDHEYTGVSLSEISDNNFIDYNIGFYNTIKYNTHKSKGAIVCPPSSVSEETKKYIINFKGFSITREMTYIIVAGYVYTEGYTNMNVEYYDANDNIIQVGGNNYREVPSYGEYGLNKIRTFIIPIDVANTSYVKIYHTVSYIEITSLKAISTNYPQVYDTTDRGKVVNATYFNKFENLTNVFNGNDFVVKNTQYCICSYNSSAAARSILHIVINNTTLSGFIELGSNDNRCVLYIGSSLEHQYTTNIVCFARILTRPIAITGIMFYDTTINKYILEFTLETSDQGAVARFFNLYTSMNTVIMDMIATTTYDQTTCTQKRDIVVYNALYSERPTGIDKGFCHFDETLGKPIWYAGNNIWVDATDVIAGTPTSGTFANKPTVATNNIPVGFKYFCTDKQTTEGATDGIEIIHKGNDVWVDALGRVVS